MRENQVTNNRNKINLVLYVLCSLILVHCGSSLEQSNIEVNKDLLLEQYLPSSSSRECRISQDIENYPYASLKSTKYINDLVERDKYTYKKMNNNLESFLNLKDVCKFNDVDDIVINNARYLRLSENRVNMFGERVPFSSFELTNRFETFNVGNRQFNSSQRFCLMSQGTVTQEPFFGFSIGGDAGPKTIKIYGEGSFLTTESEMGMVGFLKDYTNSYNICLESDLKKYIWFRKIDDSGTTTDEEPSFIYTYFPEDYPSGVNQRSIKFEDSSNIFYQYQIPFIENHDLDTKIYSISRFSQKDENWLEERGYTQVNDDSLGDSNTYSLSDKTHFGYVYYFKCKDYKKMCIKHNNTESEFYMTKNFSFEELKSMTREEINEINNLVDSDWQPVIPIERKRRFFIDFVNLKDWKVEELNSLQFGMLMNYLGVAQNIRSQKQDVEIYANFEDISIESISNLTEEHMELGGIAMGWMSSPEQLQAVSSAGMKHIPHWSLTPDKIRLLSGAQLEDVLNNISKDSEDFEISEALKITEDVKREQIQSITLKALSEFFQLPKNTRYLTQDQLETITPRQIQRSISNQNSIPYDYFSNLFTPEQISLISHDHLQTILQAILEACEVRGKGFGSCHPFDGDQLEALSLEQFKMIYPNPKKDAPSITYYNYSKEKIFYLRENEKFSEIASFIENNEDFFKKSESYINSVVFSPHFKRVYYLEPKEFRNITLDQMNSFPDFFVIDIPLHKLMEIPVFGQWLLPDYMSEIQYFAPFVQTTNKRRRMPAVTKEYIQSIPLNQIPDIDPDVFVKLDFEKYQFLTSDQLLAMTNEQLARATKNRDKLVFHIMERDEVDEETKNNFLRLIISLNDNYNTSEALIEKNIERVKRSVEKNKQEWLENCEHKSKRSSYWKETILNECMREWRFTQD